MSFLIGFCAGFFGGLVGLGGGVIMIPLMTSILKTTQHQAHGTSLMAIIFTGIAGAAAYGLGGNVDLIAAMLLAATAMITAKAGAHFANSLSECKLKRVFGGFLLFVTFLLLIKPFLPVTQVFETGWPKVAVLLLTGMFTGFLSGMMGVGGGTIMVPALVLLTGYTQHMAQGSSLLAMVPIGFAGTYTHWKLGNVRTDISKWLIPGILIGTFLAGYFTNYIPQDILRIIFSAVLIWTGVKYLRVKNSHNQSD
ncbi:MAG: sulfite exporter TauE/SafE family protein [Nitrospirota bacterium]